MIRGKPLEGSDYRLALGVIGLLAVLLLAAAPMFSPSMQVPRSQLQDESTEESDIDDATIRGEMTLAEVETLTDVPVSYIVEQLGLPQATSPDQRLGQLRRKHGFQIDEVRRIVTEFDDQ